MAELRVERRGVMSLIAEQRLQGSVSSAGALAGSEIGTYAAGTAGPGAFVD
jgi:hypothetical protein